MTTTTISTTADLRMDLQRRASAHWAESLAHYTANEAANGAPQREEDRAVHTVGVLTQLLDDAHASLAEAVAQLEAARARGEIDARTAALVDALHAEGENVTRAWFTACDVYMPLADATPSLNGAPKPWAPPAAPLVTDEHRAEFAQRESEGRFIFSGEATCPDCAPSDTTCAVCNGTKRRPPTVPGDEPSRIASDAIIPTQEVIHALADLRARVEADPSTPPKIIALVDKLRAADVGAILVAIDEAMTEIATTSGSDAE